MKRASPIVIAEKIGVKISIINCIKNKSIYPNITGKYNFPNANSTKIDEYVVKAMCNDIFVNKIQTKDVVDKYDVSAATVRHIRRGAIHTDISDKYRKVCYIEYFT